MSDDYYSTKESVEEYIRLAKDVDGSQLISKLNNYLPAASAVLEIGSGPGTDFQILKKYHRVVGSDYSVEFLNRLTSNYQGDKFLNLDAKTLATDKKFDGLYSNKVLQHLTDEDLERSILRQVDILNSNGMICHSFWKGEGEEIFKGLLVNYQTEANLRFLFQGYFDILLLEEYNEFEVGDSLLLIGKKRKRFFG